MYFNSRWPTCAYGNNSNYETSKPQLVSLWVFRWLINESLTLYKSNMWEL